MIKSSFMSSPQLRNIPMLALAAITLSALAGCNVGPKYTRPNYTAPPAFRGADDAAVASDAKGSLGDEQWSAVYQEPELQELIRKALVNNYDLRIAAQHILEQQAQVKITHSQAFPTLSVGGTGIGATLPSSLVGTAISSPLVEGSFNLSAAWTPDFWGLYRKQTEAARAQLLAQTWAQRAVRMTLVQQVATAYLQLRALDRELEITRDTLKARQGSVDLTSAKPNSCSTLQRPRCRNWNSRFSSRRTPSRFCWGRIRAPSRIRTLPRLRLPPRICLPDCLPNCWSAAPTSSRPKLLLSRPTRKLVSLARSFFRACRSAVQAEWGETA
jgi:Outer membrane efflux protein